MFCKIVPDTLRAYRDRLKWSQQQLAEKAGVNRQTILRKENAKEPEDTQVHIAEKLARAMGVSVQDLCRPVQNEAFFLDVDIFSHLKICLNDGDHFHVKKFFDYILYNLAQSLDEAGLELAKDWKESALSGPIPSLPSLPVEDINHYNRMIISNFDTLVNDFFEAWRLIFGGRHVSTEVIIDNANRQEWFYVLKQLLIFEKGRVNSFKLRALLYRVTKLHCGKFKLWLVPFADQEMCVRSDKGQSEEPALLPEPDK